MRGAKIHGGFRAGDVKRNAVPPRQNRHHVGADFIGHITIRCHPICSHNDRINLSLGHQMSRHVVADQGYGDALLHHLPAG